MEHFWLSLNTILPQFIWMAVGYAARNLFAIGDRWVLETNKYVYRIFLPALLFTNLYGSDLSVVFKKDTLLLIAFVYAAVLITVGLLMALVPRLVKENARRSVIIQGVFRSNTAMFGIPVALSLYGEGNIAIASLIAASVVPLFNVLGIIVLETHRGGKHHPVVILKKIAANPLILSILLGIAFNALRIRLPEAVITGISGFSNATSTLAFFVLGASFSFQAAAHNIRALSTTVIAKLVVLPFVWIAGGALLGFRGQGMLALLVVFAPPMAVSGYAMAVEMGGDGELCSEIVVFSSAFSVLTMFLWIFGLKTLMLI